MSLDILLVNFKGSVEFYGFEKIWYTILLADNVNNFF